MKEYSERTCTIAVAALLVLVCFGVYMNTLYNGFVYDDTLQVLGNRYITNLAYLPDIFFNSVWSFNPETTTSNYYRPVMHTIYMAEYHLFGLKPWGVAPGKYNVAQP